MEENKLLEIFDKKIHVFYVGKKDDFNSIYENAKNETINSYNITKKYYDEKYIEAERITKNIKDMESKDEIVLLLNKAIDTCPYFFDAKITKIYLTLEGNQEFEKYEELREEMKHFLDKTGLNIDSSPSIFGSLFAKAYSALLLRLILSASELGLYNDARKYAEMLYRLDKYNLCDSLYDYCYTLILNEKYNLALNFIKDIYLPQYMFLKYFIYISLKKYNLAFECYKTLQVVNPYYCILISGLVDDFSNYNYLLSYYLEDYYGVRFYDEFNEAIINVMRSFLLFNSNENLEEYFDKYSLEQVNLLIKLPEIEMFIISLLSKSSQTIKSIYEIIKKNFDYDDSEISANLSLLEERRLIKKENSKYTITKLSIYIMRFIISMFENDNEKKEVAQ